MPKYEGSCGCYSHSNAVRYGLVAAILINFIEDKQKFFQSRGELVDGMFWSDQKAIAEHLAIEERTLYRAISKLEEEGVIVKRVGYKPGTQVRTTWWKLNSEDASNEVSETDKMVVSETDKMVVSILNKTANNNTDIRNSETAHSAPSVMSFQLMVNIIQGFIRNHKDATEVPLVFNRSKLKEYYQALREWAEDNSISINSSFIHKVLTNVVADMENDGFMNGKPLELAFKPTVLSHYIQGKAKEKGNLNDNEW